jgi:protoporphyrinogen oxidase
VECRAVDVVRYNEAPEPGKLPEPLLLLDGGLSTLPSNASAAAAADTSAATLIYEVVQEIKHNEDEWMYQLQKSSSKTGNVIVTAAMEAAAVGNYGDALSQLSQIEASHNPTDARIWRSPLVQRLVQFCEKQLQPD